MLPWMDLSQQCEGRFRNGTRQARQAGTQDGLAEIGRWRPAPATSPAGLWPLVDMLFHQEPQVEGKTGRVGGEISYSL